MGRNSVRETLRFAPERVVELFTDNPGRVPPDVQALISEGEWRLNRVGTERLTELCHSDSHQGLAARLSERPVIQLKDFLRELPQGERVLILLLDSIMDPHNFGAILRAAECCGARAVVWSKNRGCGVTPVVTKSAVGATELVPLIPVSNLSQAVDTLHDAGFEVVVADGGEGDILHSFSFSERSVLILGSEGEGVQPLLKKKADRRVQIPMAGRIDSLNVSQAAAVFLAHWNVSPT